MNLPTTGVEVVPERPLKYKRIGNQISVIGSVRNVKNVQVFATLTSGFRPVQNIAFTVLAYGNDPAICEVTIQSGGGLFVNGVQSGQTVHIVADFML
ncbi:Phage protein [Bacillus cereus]|nr:Phage protein [Bacillus cereus]